MKKLKNLVINQTYDAIAGASANTLPLSEAYKVVKWKNAFDKANTAINDLIKTAREQSSITDEDFRKIGKAVNGRGEVVYSLLSPELAERYRKYDALVQKILDDTQEIDVKSMTFENWHLLSKENSFKLGANECDLEGVLFDSLVEEPEPAPEAEKPKTPKK